MTNIYVYPLAAPSFEYLSTEAQRPANEFSATIGEGKQTQTLDENENEVFVDATKTETGYQPSGACGSIKDEHEGLHHTALVIKPPNQVGTKITGDEFETPSGTLTTLRLSAGTQDISSSPTRISPVYCFHSFTYGVGGLKEVVADKNRPPVQNGAVWGYESYDADSQNVWHTRTVVDSEESLSPTFRCEWNSETEGGEISNDSVSSKETGNVDASGEEKTTSGKTPLNSEQEANENSREESCEKNVTKMFTRRLSPEGAEYSAGDEGDSASYLMVPDKRLVAEAQRRDTLWSSLGRSPSGRMDDKDYWTLDDALGGKEVADGDCHDRVPLLHPGKPRVRYTSEVGFEEMEEGILVTCFPCCCVIL